MSIKFVAEIGLNHNGNFDLCQEMIKQAKFAGADVVKFQLGWRSQENEINHIDAVLWYCEKHDLEPDSVNRLITKGLKEKIEANARELNFLEKTATLPI